MTQAQDEALITEGPCDPDPNEKAITWAPWKSEILARGVELARQRLREALTAAMRDEVDPDALAELGDDARGALEAELALRVEAAIGDLPELRAIDAELERTVEDLRMVNAACSRPYPR